LSKVDFDNKTEQINSKLLQIDKLKNDKTNHQD